MASLPRLLVVVMLAMACRRGDSRAVDRRHDAARAATAATDAPPARGGADDPMAEKLRHCPVAVDGATTALRDTDDGVELTITAPTTAAAEEVRRRGAHLVTFTAGQAARGEHGGGAGGGFMQNCPVVTRATTIAATDVLGGSRLIVRPVAPYTVAELRGETRRRYAAFTRP